MLGSARTSALSSRTRRRAFGLAVPQTVWMSRSNVKVNTVPDNGRRLAYPGRMPINRMMLGVPVAVAVKVAEGLDVVV